MCRTSVARLGSLFMKFSVCLFASLGLAGVAFAHPGTVIGGPVLTQKVTLVSGDWTFETHPGWGLVPTNEAVGPTHGGIVIDKAGLVYASTDGALGIVVFDRDGRFVRSIAPELSGIHAMILREEDGHEFIYAAHLRGNQVVKLGTDGTVAWKLGFPEASGLYKNPGQFKPTSIAVAPDGNLFVADGYGQSVIHKFDKDRNYLKTFGGADAGSNRFRTCHGVLVDPRGSAPTLLVCDRENRRISRWDLDGHCQGIVTDGLRRPCTMSLRGDYLAVAELEARVAVIGPDGKVVAELGSNPDKAQWANYGVPPAKWEPGVFTAPHGVCWDAEGNLYVEDWNSTGRLTRLAKVKAP